MAPRFTFRQPAAPVLTPSRVGELYDQTFDPVPRFFAHAVNELRASAAQRACCWSATESAARLPVTPPSRASSTS